MSNGDCKADSNTAELRFCCPYVNGCCFDVKEPVVDTRLINAALAIMALLFGLGENSASADGDGKQAIKVKWSASSDYPCLSPTLIDGGRRIAWVSNRRLHIALSNSGKSIGQAQIEVAETLSFKSLISASSGKQFFTISGEKRSDDLRLLGKTNEIPVLALMGDQLHLFGASFGKGARGYFMEASDLKVAKTFDLPFELIACSSLGKGDLLLAATDGRLFALNSSRIERQCSRGLLLLI